MASPVITQITPAGPQTAPDNTVLTFTVAAQDADARTETLQITATDAEGNVSSISETVITWTDPVTISAKIKEAGSPTVVTVAGNKVTVAG